MHLMRNAAKEWLAVGWHKVCESVLGLLGCALLSHLGTADEPREQGSSDVVIGSENDNRDKRKGTKE